MNLYQPHLMRIAAIVDETSDTRTLRLDFIDPAVADRFSFLAGQFAEYSAFGAGECTFCIASPPTRAPTVECSFKVVGKVTSALNALEIGNTIGFRGPYGNAFPIDEMMGRNIVLIAGGIGLAPVRSVILNILDLRDRFGEVTIIYGARSVSDLVYRHEFAGWQGHNMKLWQTVDPGGETDDWSGEVGFVPTIVERAAPSAAEADAIVCGPPIMIKYTLPVLRQLGFADDHIFTTLENRMKCGLGKCGRCNIGHLYVCKDGPVFTARQLTSLPPEY